MNKKFKILLPAIATSILVSPALATIVSCQPEPETKNFTATSYTEKFVLENTVATRNEDYVTVVKTKKNDVDFLGRKVFIKRLLIGDKELKLDEDFSFVPQMEAGLYPTALLTVFGKNVTSDISITFDYNEEYPVTVLTEGFASNASYAIEHSPFKCTITSDTLQGSQFMVDKIFSGTVIVPENHHATGQTGYTLGDPIGKTRQLEITPDFVVGPIQISLKLIETPPKHKINILYNEDNEFSCDTPEIEEGQMYTSVTVRSKSYTSAEFKPTKVIVNGKEYKPSVMSLSSESWKVNIDVAWTYGDIAIYCEITHPEEYTVKGNHLYGINKRGEQFPLSKSQLDEMKGGFIVDLNDGTYRYDAPTDSEGRKRSISDYMERASTIKSVQYQIYLVGGEYQLPSHNAKIQNTQFYITGILGPDGEKLASLKCISGEDAPGATLNNINLTDFYVMSFDSLKIIGSKYNSTGSNWAIVGPILANYVNCDFEGKQRINAERSQFIYCNFDSSMIDEDRGAAGRKTDYSMFLVNNRYAWFEGCNFKSIGKAVKVYATEEIARVDTQIVFNKCRFKLVDSDIQYQLKDAVEVQTDYKGLTGIDPLSIYWDGITSDSDITWSNQASNIWILNDDNNKYNYATRDSGTGHFTQYFAFCGGFDIGDTGGHEQTRAEMVDLHQNELPNK